MPADIGRASARPLPWGALVLAVLAALAGWLGELLPAPWGAIDRGLLHAVRWPALGVVAVMLAAWTAWSALRARSQDPLPETAGGEEPLLAEPHLVSRRSETPVVALAGLERRSGVSTLVFNLAVSLAALGEVSNEEGSRAPRPACLLAEGALTDALRLSPLPLDDHISRHPFQITPEVVNLASGHPSGAELFCLKHEGHAVEQLRPLLSELRRHYDAVLLDGWRGGRQLLDVAIDCSDALVLVGLPPAASVEAAGLWMEHVWGLGLEGKTALLVNRVRAWPKPPLELSLAFLYHAQLPDDPRIPPADSQGFPWSVDGCLPIAERCIELARQLFPTLMPGAGADAT
jgi:hypothetical protein